MAQLVNPYKEFKFLVEIQGIQQAGFMECSSVGSHLDVVEYREGNNPSHVYKFAGQAHYDDITLKWGMTDNQDLYKWHLQIVKGNLTRQNGSVVQLDDTGAEKIRWNLYRAWPSKYTVPAYNAKGNGLAIASLTLSYEYAEIA
jgi:phage tail-like protein